MEHLVVLSGAGVSAESGIKTFRASDGLWENHRVEDVASPDGFARDPQLVLNFYNQRRAQLREVNPNAGHRIIAQLEEFYRVSVITQNIDDLHERAGSNEVVHLHGELFKARPVGREQPILDWTGDIRLGDTDEAGRQLRPHIVWFGEAVPMIERAAQLVATADIVVIIGTSMQVYPAAGLVGLAPRESPVYYVDPKPTISYELRQRGNIRTVEMVGSKGMARVFEELTGQRPSD